MVKSQYTNKNNTETGSTPGGFVSVSDFRFMAVAGIFGPTLSVIKRLIVVLLLVCSAGSLHAEITPLDVIRSSNTLILDIYGSSPEITQKVLGDITDVMEKVTDFGEIADRVVQKTCSDGNDHSCERLKNEFITLLKLNATRKLGRYRADRFDYLGQVVEGRTARVKTIAWFQKDSVELDYILENKAGRWVIVNYIADGVDTVRNYQSQFSRIISKKSVDFLIGRLAKKNQLYRRERSET